MRAWTNNPGTHYFLSFYILLAHLLHLVKHICVFAKEIPDAIFRQHATLEVLGQ